MAYKRLWILSSAPRTTNSSLDIYLRADVRVQPLASFSNYTVSRIEVLPLYLAFCVTLYGLACSVKDKMEGVGGPTSDTAVTLST